MASISPISSMHIKSVFSLFLQDEIEAEKPPPSENALLPRPKIIHLTRKEVRCCYHSSTLYDGKVMFLQESVCLSTWGTKFSGPRSLLQPLVPGPFWWVSHRLWSQVPSLVLWAPQSCHWSCPKSCPNSCLEGVPQPRTGVCPSARTGITPWPSLGYFPGQNRGTPHHHKEPGRMYGTGSMPLEVTQGDFLLK